MILGSSLATAGMVMFRDVSKPFYVVVGMGGDITECCGFELSRKAAYPA